MHAYFRCKEKPKLNLMKKNVGNLDRTIRIAIAIVIAVLTYMNVLTGTLSIVLLSLAAIFVVTSFLSFCPIYAVLGMNSCPVNSKK